MNLNKRQRQLYLEQLEGRELLNADNVFHSEQEARIDTFHRAPSHQHESRLQHNKAGGDGPRVESLRNDTQENANEQRRPHAHRHHHDHNRQRSAGLRSVPSERSQLNSQVTNADTSTSILQPSPIASTVVSSRTPSSISLVNENTNNSLTNSSPINRDSNFQGEGEGPPVVGPRPAGPNSIETANSPSPDRQSTEPSQTRSPVVLASAEFPVELQQSEEDAAPENRVQGETYESKVGSSQLIALNEFLLLDQEATEILQRSELFEGAEDDGQFDLGFLFSELSQESTDGTDNDSLASEMQNQTGCGTNGNCFEGTAEADLQMLAFDISLRKQKPTSQQVYNFTLPAGLCNIDSIDVLVQAVSKPLSQIRPERGSPVDEEKTQVTPRHWLLSSCIASAAALSLYLRHGETRKRWNRFSSMPQRSTDKDTQDLKVKSQLH